MREVLEVVKISAPPRTRCAVWEDDVQISLLAAFLLAQAGVFNFAHKLFGEILMATWARRLFKFRKDQKLRAILRQFVQSRFTKTFVFANIFAQKCLFLLKASQNFLLFRIFPLATFLRKGKSKFSRKDENKTFPWYFLTAVNIYVRHGNQLVDSTAP